MEPGRSAQRRPHPLYGVSLVVVTLLALSAAIGAGSFANDLQYRHLIGQAIATGVPSMELADVDHRQNVLDVTDLAVFGVCAVLFLIWFHRAYSNLERLGVYGQRWSAGWAVGAWFVPVLNLIRVPRIAADLWRGSDPSRPAATGIWREATPAVVALWWGLLLVDRVLGYVASDYESNAHSLVDIRTGLTVLLVAHVVAIAAAGSAILLVRGVTARQRARSTALALYATSLTVSAVPERVPAFAGAPANVEALRTPGGTPCPSCGFENHALAASCLRCHKRLT